MRLFDPHAVGSALPAGSGMNAPRAMTVARRVTANKAQTIEPGRLTDIFGRRGSTGDILKPKLSSNMELVYRAFASYAWLVTRDENR